MVINTFVLTYLMLAVFSVAVGLTATIVGVLVFRRWRGELATEMRDVLEQRVSLVITLMVLGLSLRLFMVPLWFFTLHSLIPSIPGAMCLAGVHQVQSPSSFIASALKLALPLVYVYWLALNRLDRTLEEQPFMRRKLAALLPIGCLLLVEAAFDLHFLTSVRPIKVTCCTSLFDSPTASIPAALATTTDSWLVTFYVLTATACLALLVSVRSRARPYLNKLVLFAAPLGLVAFVLALHTRISPLFLNTPYHHCIFCVWQNSIDTIVATGLVLGGTALALVSASTARSGANRSDREIAFVKRAGKWALILLASGTGLLTMHFVMALAEAR